MEKIRISSLEGNRQLLDGGAMFGNAPKALWHKWFTADSLNRIELACRSMLVQIGDKNILLETGIGAFFEPKLAKRYGVNPTGKHVLLDSLKEFGLEHSDIDYVILSHLHFDHAGGLLPSYKESPNKDYLLFNNAKIITGLRAWQRAIKPHGRDKASFIPEMIKLLNDSKRLIFVDTESTKNELPKIIDDNFSFFETNGHTPGQLHSVVKAETANIVFCGDLITGTIWVHAPLTMGYDRFPELLIDEKINLYQQMDLEKTIFFYTHDPKFSGSKVTLNEKGKYDAYDFVKRYMQQAI